MSSENEGTSRENYAKYAIIGFVALVAIGVVYHYWSRPPQMGTSEEVFNTVDALYTAVRNRDEKRIGECEVRLKGYREAGKLPESAANALDAIVRKARSGAWDTAIARLYEFMLAQRREGVIEPEHKPKATKKKSPKST